MAAPAAAQGTAGPGTGTSGVLLGFGVSFLNSNDATGTGVTVDFRKNVYSAASIDLGVVGDVSFHRRSLDEDDFFDVDGSETATTFMGGVRVTWSQLDRVAPFAQGLFGAIRSGVTGEVCDFVEAFDEACSETDGIVGVGGGVDVRLNDRWNFRGQIDFLRMLIDTSDFDDDVDVSKTATRFFIGVSTRLGGS